MTRKQNRFKIVSIVLLTAGVIFYMKFVFDVRTQNHINLVETDTMNCTVMDTINATDILSSEDHRNFELKYILLWSSGLKSPFYHIGEGQSNFHKFNCTFQNCFVTDNKTYLPNVQDYDTIVFNGNDVINRNKEMLPQMRSLYQKYVFVGTEPARIILACNPVLDDFFNWTWTYRLDSDVLWRYISIYDLNGSEVGPRQRIDWPKTMDPIDNNTKVILNGKSKAAAWFVSRCKSFSHREDIVQKVKSELMKFHLTVDVYGACGPLKCKKNNYSKCRGLVKDNYYFYLSLENSFSMDYVTEKLLIALNNYAVPVVLGGADYSRFLPPGSYLDARKLDPKRLAETMRDVINNKTRYYDFFRWRNHFQYKQSDNSADVCNICTALNDPQRVKAISTYEKFREWWNDEWNYLCRKH